MSLVVEEAGARISAVLVNTAAGLRQISVDDNAGEIGYHGVSIGRWANRIANAQFELDDVVYDLVANEGRHQLHGGPAGFHRRHWQGKADLDNGAGVVSLSMTSPDGDQGFPGLIKAIATMTLIGTRLSITYHATTSAPTPVNLTNHLYWNLGGGSLGGHRLMIAADRFIEVDDDKIPIDGPPHSVAGTRFDCRSGREVDAVVAAGGYDHCFVLADDADGPAVSLSHRDGVSLAVSTNQMGAQVYTGQHLDRQRQAIAIEPQRAPDMVNRPDFGDPILRPGDEYRSSIVIDVSL